MMLSPLQLMSCCIISFHVHLIAAESSPIQSWIGQCGDEVQPILRAAERDQKTLPPGFTFVDEYGHKVANLQQNGARVRGIDYPTCVRQCSRISGTSTWRFVSFSNALNAWLLPWIALTAQLPYETQGRGEDIIAAFIGVGSPSLLTYSLFQTVFTRLRIAKEFGALIGIASRGRIWRAYNGLGQRLAAMSYVLGETQQAPIKANDWRGGLSTLLFHPSNGDWWRRVARDLSNTRRGYTQSFILQTTVAIISWILTIGVAFSHIGDVTVALTLASSSVWLWLIPITFGFVSVGTQARRFAIADALEQLAHRPNRINSASPQPTSTTLDSQWAIQPRSGVNPRDHTEVAESPGEPSAGVVGQSLQLSILEDPRNSASTRSSMIAQDLGHGPDVESSGSFTGQTVVRGDEDLPRQRLWTAEEEGLMFGIFDLTGDEGTLGATYNYARVLKHYRFTSLVVEVLRRGMENLMNNELPDGQTVPRSSDEPLESYIGNSSSDALSRWTDLQDHVPAYISAGKVSPRLKRDTLLACGCALFIQWGTAGPSIIIAYSTVTKGIGCRSGGYLIYAMAGTISWLFLLCSSYLSNAMMLDYERNGEKPHGWKLWRPITFIVLFWPGKIIAILNAVWLFVSTMFEIVGFYDSCWCNSDYPSLGASGYVVLFSSVNQLAPSATHHWIGALIFVFLVCGGMTLLVFLLSKSTAWAWKK